ncbi:MAG: PQQ-binding-like beta-propeller repeat protein [Planctomycetota bacterium]|nr:PQQ-binding-like beta-propeller repeat protein [Planctomycetota bacterium]
MRWSTADREEWKDLRPLNAPAAATGRVYVLALAAGKPNPAGVLTAKIYLACLDAEDGRMLWRRLLGTSQTNTQLLDLAANGMPVTLHGGWIYCSSDLGLIAKCDARDGAPEWLAAYGLAEQAGRPQVQSCREGASPLVAGEAIVVAPRDHSGLLAFDAATGKKLWETTLVPSDRLVGLIGTTLMTRSQWELGGVDLQSGRELWTLALEADSPAQTCLRGQEMLLLAHNTLKRISPAGAVVEALALTPKAGEQFALLPDGTLAALGEAIEPAPAPTAAAPPALAGPLVETWRLPAARPMLLAPPPDRPGDSFCVVSGRSITRVRTQPTVGVAWTQSLPVEPAGGVFAGEFILLSDGSSLTALDLATGAVRWHVPMGFGIYSFDGDGQIAVAVEISNDPNATVVEMATGKVLWHKIISAPMRFGDLGAQRVRIRREDAGRTIAFYWMGALYGDKGWRASELTVEARTGTLLGLHPCLAEEAAWPRAFAFETRGAYFLDSLGCFKAVTPDGAATTFASKHAMDMGSVNSCPPAVGVVPTPGGVYAKSLGELLWFDSAARREVVCELPRNAMAGRMCLIYAARELGEKLLVVSGTRGRSAAYVPGQGAVFADLFDRTTGAHLAQQELPGLTCLDYPRTGYETQAEIVGDAVVVTGRDGVYVFAGSAASAELALPRADAGEGFWQGAGEIPLAGADGKPIGAVRIAHDNRRLFLSVTAPGSPQAAFRGRGTFDNAAECVDVALGGPSVSGRWLVGVDSAGRGVARDVDGEAVGGVSVVRSVRPETGATTYEISLPLPESLFSSEPARHLRLSLAADWGGRGRGTGAIYLQPLPRGGQEALKALAAAGGAAGLARAGLKGAIDDAKDAGEKYLSQWVYITGGVRPTALCVGLLTDGQWRYASWHDPTPPTALARPWNERANLTWWTGPIPTQGNWVELRVPLSAMGMGDRAIEGVVFRTESPGRVLWDRTSVVYPGGTRVLVEGAMPAGQPTGAWTWAGDVGRTSGKVHEGPAVTSVDEPAEHGVILAAAAAEHAGAVPGKAVLTQWVFLDPARARVGPGRFGLARRPAAARGAVDATSPAVGPHAAGRRALDRHRVRSDRRAGDLGRHRHRGRRTIRRRHRRQDSPHARPHRAAGLGAGGLAGHRRRRARRGKGRPGREIRRADRVPRPARFTAVGAQAVHRRGLGADRSEGRRNPVDRRQERIGRGHGRVRPVRHRRAIAGAGVRRRRFAGRRNVGEGARRAGRVAARGDDVGRHGLGRVRGRQEFRPGPRRVARAAQGPRRRSARADDPGRQTAGARGPVCRAAQRRRRGLGGLAAAVRAGVVGGGHPIRRRGPRRQTAPRPPTGAGRGLAPEGPAGPRRPGGRVGVGATRRQGGAHPRGRDERFRPRRHRSDRAGDAAFGLSAGGGGRGRGKGPARTGREPAGLAAVRLDATARGRARAGQDRTACRIPSRLARRGRY